MFLTFAISNGGLHGVTIWLLHMQLAHFGSYGSWPLVVTHLQVIQSINKIIKNIFKIKIFIKTVLEYYGSCAIFIWSRYLFNKISLKYFYVSSAHLDFFTLFILKYAVSSFFSLMPFLRTCSIAKPQTNAKFAWWASGCTWHTCSKGSILPSVRWSRLHSYLQSSLNLMFS